MLPELQVVCLIQNRQLATKIYKIDARTDMSEQITMKPTVVDPDTVTAAQQAFARLQAVGSQREDHRSAQAG
jgi:hypothetical protein